LLKVEYPRTDTLLILPSAHSIVTPDTFRHATKIKKYISAVLRETPLYVMQRQVPHYAASPIEQRSSNEF